MFKKNKLTPEQQSAINRQRLWRANAYFGDCLGSQEPISTEKAKDLNTVANGVGPNLLNKSPQFAASVCKMLGLSFQIVGENFKVPEVGSKDVRPERISVVVGDGIIKRLFVG